MRERITTRHLAIGGVSLVILFLAVAVWHVFLPIGHAPVEHTPSAAFEHRQVGGNELSGRVTIWITDAETNTTETVVWYDSASPPTLNWDVPLIITDQDETGPTRVPAVTFDLTPRDHVRLQYEGPPLDGEDEPITTTLGEFVVGDQSPQRALTFTRL